MSLKCNACQLINFPDALVCKRCGRSMAETENISPKRRFNKPGLVVRAVVCVAMCLFVLAGFYASLVLSAEPLSYEERRVMDDAVLLLEEKGFADEVFYLRYLAIYRSTDNWLNASVEKESAYAATNYPFEIVTIYPDFFKYPADKTERAAILLHEARHLKGDDEKEAYEFVWKNRKKLGWTRESYELSAVWKDVRRQTREYSPNLFVCDFNDFGDCTE